MHENTKTSTPSKLYESSGITRNRKTKALYLINRRSKLNNTNNL